MIFNNGISKRMDVMNSLTKTLLMCVLISGCSSQASLNLSTQQSSGDNPMNAALKTIYSTSTFNLYEIASFDIYVEEQNIHLLVSGKANANDKKNVIDYAYSRDGGHHWHNKNSLISHLPEAMAKRGNDIQLAANGDYLVAMWQTRGEFPSMGPMVSAYSTDRGITWNQGTNPAQANDRAQAHIDLIADEQGKFHAVWLEDPQENGYQSLRYAQSIDHGKHWSKPITLDDSTCSCCWNTLTLSPNNHVNVLYRDMTPRDMSLMQSIDAGLTWKKISTVGDFQWKFEGCPHIGGGLTSVGTDKNFQLHSVVWTGAEEKSGLYYLASKNGGQSWSPPRKLGDMATNGDVAAYISKDTHHVSTIWNEIEDDGMSILLSQSIDEGVTWSAPKRLSEASNSPTQPKIIATQHGFLAIWTENNSSGKSVLAWYAFK